MKWNAEGEAKLVPDSCRVKGAGYIGSLNLAGCFERGLLLIQ